MNREEHHAFVDWKYGLDEYGIMNLTPKQPERGERVRLHMNLNKKCFSVSRYFKPRNTWYVTNHTPRILLKDCEMRVSEAGRQRTVREGVRNVHAYVYGKFASMGEFVPDVELPVDFVDCRYNPFKHDSFYVPGDCPISRCRWFIGTEKYTKVLPEGEMYESV